MSEEIKQEKPAERNLRKVLVATVVSAKMDKTLVVRADLVAAAPLFRHVVNITSKCYVHDENNEAKIGDVVQIMETRPLSKLKRWRLVKILKAAVTD